MNDEVKKKWVKTMRAYLKDYKKKNEKQYQEMSSCVNKMLANIIGDPFNDKYRSISSKSKMLNSLFFSKENGQAILKQIGFEFLKME